jgi:hypothetical protein
MLMLIQSLKKIKFLRMLSRLLYRTGLQAFLIRKPILLIAQKVFGLKIIKRDELIKNDKKYQVLRFGSEEVVGVGEPYNLRDFSEEDLREIPDLMKTKSFVAASIDKPFVCEITNAELVGPTSIGFDEDGNIIYETAMLPFKELKVEKAIPARALIQKLLSSDFELDTACSLVFAWNKNYHHWLVDTLTRIEGIEYYQEQTGIKPTLIVESSLTPVQIESLKLLGYGLDDCIRWNVSKIKVKRLVVPSFRRNERVSPQACIWLRQRLLSQLSDITSERLSFSPKIFISRRQAAFRRVINEDEILRALAPLGFVSYVLEEMSFSNQVRLFSQAEIIVTPHGAGLTNMIFSQNPTTIELFGPRNIYNNVDFFALSQSLGFKYGFLRCESPPMDRRKEDSDMIVDTTELLSLIHRI